MANTILSRILMAAAACCMAASLTVSAEVAGFAKTFTMTLRGAVDGSTLNDFPLAVRVAEGKVPGFSYSDSLEDGRDIRFSLEDGTELAAACDTWNPSGESVFWVLVPALAPGMTVKMYVGKAGDAGYATPSDVWSSYIGVWHLNETGDAAESIAESSANGITGTGGPNSIATADGVFGGARGTRTSGVKRPIFSTDNNAALDAGTAFTVSGWIRSAGEPTGPTSPRARILTRRRAGAYSSAELTPAALRASTSPASRTSVPEPEPASFLRRTNGSSSMPRTTCRTWLSMRTAISSAGASVRFTNTPSTARLGFASVASEPITARSTATWTRSAIRPA